MTLAAGSPRSLHQGCAGALRDERVGFDRLEGDGRLFTGTLDLINPDHPVATYGLRPTVAQVRPQATADALKGHSFDRKALGARGLGYEKLDQLTIEVLLGVR